MSCKLNIVVYLRILRNQQQNPRTTPSALADTFRQLLVCAQQQIKQLSREYKKKMSLIFDPWIICLNIEKAILHIAISSIRLPLILITAFILILRSNQTMILVLYSCSFERVIYEMLPLSWPSPVPCHSPWINVVNMMFYIMHFHDAYIKDSSSGNACLINFTTRSSYALAL